jgi:outer membrane protein assembly factor BamE (lipoprotein component of BamABCDE complex)
MKISKIIFTCFLFLIACATTQQYNQQLNPEEQNNLRRKNYIQTHPNLSIDFRNAILNAQILIGMNKQQVLASWGNPNNTKKTVDISGSQEKWLYLSPLRPLSSLEAGALTPAMIAQYYQLADSNRKRIVVYFVKDELIKYEEQ